MKLSCILEDVQIQFVDPEDADDLMVRQCYDIAHDSGINISRSKELTIVALDGQIPVGAIWSSFVRDTDISQHDDKDIYCFDFDVAVAPTARGASRIGPKLIDAALRYYKSLRSDVDSAYIRVWVVNPKLAKFLANRYGFESEGRGGEWRPDSPHMTYYE
jgi:ribosomal protein S18 acetylase RimI-like enzyme